LLADLLALGVERRVEDALARQRAPTAIGSAPRATTIRMMQLDIVATTTDDEMFERHVSL